MTASSSPLPNSDIDLSATAIANDHSIPVISKVVSSSEVVSVCAEIVPNAEIQGAIEVVPHVTEVQTPHANSAVPGGALTNQRGSFSAFLAPLTQDSFKRVVSEVEEKLRVVNQTLSMLDNVLDSRGFDAILNEMLRSITLKTGELLNADRTTIFLLDEERDELWAIVAEDEKGNNLELRLPKSVGIAGEVATRKAAINIRYDFYSDPRSKAAQELDKKNRYRTYTMLALPLLNDENNLVAVVQLINKLKPVHDPQALLEDKIDLEGFTQEDESVFEDFAPSIRLILESSRSFYKATQQQRAASALMKATTALSQSSLDLEETLSKVMDEAKELMQADRSTLWLLDRDRYELWTQLPINGKLQEIRISMGEGFAGQVAMSEQPVLIPFDLYDNPNSAKSKETDKRTGYRTCSMLCMPVFNADGDLIGVTQLINKRKHGDFPDYDPVNYPEAPECWRASFNHTDQEFMKAFNIQAGVALQNAKMFATIKQQEQVQRDILRSLSAGVLSTNKEGKIIAVNKHAKLLLGLTEEDHLEGKAITEVVQIKEDKKREGNFTEWFQSAIQGKAGKLHEEHQELTLMPLQGVEQHSVNLTINSIADTADSSNIYGALVVMNDITKESRLRSTLYRYMTPALANRLIRDDVNMESGNRKEVTVLFSDIRGYTTLTETMEAEEVVEMLNEYFETMVDAVLDHGGILDKYIGDAIMAVFGLFDSSSSGHARDAVETAIEMRQRLVSFNAPRPEKSKIRFGVGINSDSVISGNIGSSKRKEFTAIGDGVNVGSRLEGASKQYGCDIVISESTYTPCADHVWVRELDCIRVKGKSRPVSIYELVGLRSELIPDAKKRAIELYQKGREYYLNRKFTRAMAEFGTILEEIDSQDKAAALHLKRCQYWLDPSRLASSEDWNDGVWTLTEK